MPTFTLREKKAAPKQDPVRRGNHLRETAHTEYQNRVKNVLLSQADIGTASYSSMTAPQQRRMKRAGTRTLTDTKTEHLHLIPV